MSMKKYLITAFLVGFVTLGTELIASRVIAPLLGNSLYTWTSIIGSVLLGLAAGNYIGGKLADKYPHDKLVTSTLLAAAVAIVCIWPVSHFSYLTLLLRLPLHTAALSISIILLCIPALCLGSVYPILIKLYLSDLGQTGEQAGRLSAAGGVGSIMGVFTTGFFLTGYAGTKLSLLVLSGLLIISTFIVGKFKFKRMYVLILIWLLVIAAQSALADGTGIVFDTPYYKIRIVDTDFRGHKSRMLFLDSELHSIENVDGTRVGTYQDISPLLSAFVPQPQNILVIGGGSYNLPKDAYRFFKSDIEVAEIDPGVTQAAEKFFDLNSYPIKKITADGRVYLSTTKQKYDLIIEDAFSSSISLPWYLATEEFEQVAKEKLRDNGVYAMSIISATHGKEAGIYNSTLKTFSQVFPNHYVLFLDKNPDTIQNIFLVGVNSPTRFDGNILRTKISKLIREQHIPLDIQVATNPVPPADAVIFNDDYAPVERLSAPLVKDYFSLYMPWYLSLVQ